MAISAGPLFKFTPAFSFAVACTSRAQVEAIWARLSEGGNVLMPLAAYPFSERYGWTEDRYGLSWQIMLAAEEQGGQCITPTLMFVGEVCGKAKDAINLYTSVFPNSDVGPVLRYGRDEAPNEEGTTRYASFLLEGQQFAAMDSAPSFPRFPRPGSAGGSRTGTACHGRGFPPPWTRCCIPARRRRSPGSPRRF
jgi:predicted 3-demethylubiquinone-9 3-methyltransferase (glyoxalase superfamily)